MPITTSDALLSHLAANGIEAPTVDHPAVHTVEESRMLRGDIPGVHTKNLFLRDGKKNFFLFVTDESAAIELKKLAKKIGAKGGLSFGSADALLEHLGITPGAVSLLALVNDEARKVTLVLDAELRQAPTINCHPLVNTRTTSLSQEALAKFLALVSRDAAYVSLADEETDSPG
jgi:Ala-tRNA(Pro) deacylase